MTFVDYEKAFGRVHWPKLMEVLAKIGVGYRDRKTICNLYMNQTATVMIDGELSVRQGGLSSTIRYNIYAEFMITEALENNSDGIKIGGELVAAVRYADDQAMMSHTNAGLQRIMDALNDAGTDYGMKINIKKTKLMRISKQPGKVVKLFIDGYQIEQVSSFCYLGSIITEDGRSEKEIKCRIGMAKSKFYDNLKVFTEQLSTTTKKQMIKSLIMERRIVCCRSLDNEESRHTKIGGI